ncbi:MAG TPA: hypothetical protein PLP05_12640, partial [Sedimentisphaerales bacterium]|nr:hypothetical protein [Sedimentisphaerales bacterium]
GVVVLKSEYKAVINGSATEVIRSGLEYQGLIIFTLKNGKIVGDPSQFPSELKASTEIVKGDITFRTESIIKIETRADGEYLGATTATSQMIIADDGNGTIVITVATGADGKTSTLAATLNGKTITPEETNKILGSVGSRMIDGREWKFSINSVQGLTEDSPVEYYVEAKIKCDAGHPFTLALDGKNINFNGTAAMKLLASGDWQLTSSLVEKTGETLMVNGKLLTDATYTLNIDSILHFESDGAMNVVQGTLNLSGGASYKSGDIAITETAKGSGDTAGKAGYGVHVIDNGILYDGTIRLKDNKVTAMEGDLFILDIGASIKINGHTYTRDALGQKEVSKATADLLAKLFKGKRLEEFKEKVARSTDRIVIGSGNQIIMGSAIRDSSTFVAFLGGSGISSFIKLLEDYKKSDAMFVDVGGSKDGMKITADRLDVLAKLMT